MDKLKKYKVNAGDSDVFAVSLVESPAVESNFVALAKEEQPKPVFLSKDDKHMLYGIILRADFPIYRNDADFGEYYIEFGADAIERLERKYMKNFAQKSWTTDHQMFAEGLTLTESWLVTDPENDKSKALGLEGVTKGSWVGGCLVDDNELWAEIKEGRFKGFSVEAWCDLEEVTKEIKNQKINKENKDNKMAVKKNKFEEIVDKIKEIISDAVAEADGQDTETQEEIVEEAADAVEEVVNEQESTEETVVEASEDETSNEEIVNDVVDEVQQETETTEEAVDNLQEIIDGLKDEVEALKAENEELKKKNQNMAKMPSTKVATNGNETQKGGVKAAFASLRAQGFIK